MCSQVLLRKCPLNHARILDTFSVNLKLSDFLDSYHNLTLKSLALTLWAAKNCPAAEWILKVDDDVVVAPDLLGEYLEENAGVAAEEEEEFHCNVMNHSLIMREKSNKW